MATTSSIGATARTYVDPASWLISWTAGGWIGECYNDAEFTANGPNFATITGTATNFTTLGTGTSQSFKDTAPNALKYNRTNGVGFKYAAAYGINFQIGTSGGTVNYLTLQNLQVWNTAVNGNGALNDNAGDGTGNVVQNCIFASSGTSGGGFVVNSRSCLYRNCLAVAVGTAIDGFACPGYTSGPVMANCTVVRPSDVTAGGTAFNLVQGTATIKNCAGFGFTNFDAGSTVKSGSNNCSDKTISFGTSNQASKTYANQFQNTTNAAQDFRVKLGADLIDNGATDTTNIPAAIDIFGTARPSGSAWDIGCHEYVAAAGGATIPHSRNKRHR